MSSTRDDAQSGGFDMTSVMKTAGLLAAALVIGVAGSARAATMDVKVPFSFVVRGQTLPAGEYHVENDGAVLIIRGENGTRAAMFALSTPASGQDPAGDAPSLTFTRYETTYRLADVWASHSVGLEVHQ